MLWTFSDWQKLLLGYADRRLSDMPDTFGVSARRIFSLSTLPPAFLQGGIALDLLRDPGTCTASLHVQQLLSRPFIARRLPLQCVVQFIVVIRVVMVRLHRYPIFMDSAQSKQPLKVLYTGNGEPGDLEPAIE